MNATSSMLRLSNLALPLDHDEEALRAAIIARLNIPDGDLLDYHIFRRGHDARKRGRIQLVYTLDCTLRDGKAVLAAFKKDQHIRPTPDMRWIAPALPAGGGKGHARPVVIGAGPCGLMAALVLAQAGLKPIIIERGRAVKERTADTFALWRKSQFTAESNVQFGEGGAGTFSDGKLYSGVSDPRHLGRKVLEEFVKAGAPEEILTLSKPHIGTFRLVTVVQSLRAQIEALGGEYRFETRLEGIETAACTLEEDLSEEGSPEESAGKVGTEGAGPRKDGPRGDDKEKEGSSEDEQGGNGETLRRVVGLRLSTGEVLPAERVILAVGHSARDTFAMLNALNVPMQAKPFSIGVRIEHPQAVIDVARFGPQAGHPLLGAADYKLVHHASTGRGVYSFCMCPGGQVVAATSEEEQVVTNGMSQYSRAERNANSGIVVEVRPGVDFPDEPLAGVAFQRKWEKAAFVAGGGDYRAPAQRVGDFLAGRASTALGDVVPSYQPGVTPTDLADCLPDFVVASIREALPRFERKIKGYSMDDAVMTGVETRTSSPLRIARDRTGQSPALRGFFPAGEGAGYAGGILSAGMDGIRVAEWLIASL